MLGQSCRGRWPSRRQLADLAHLIADRVRVISDFRVMGIRASHSDSLPRRPLRGAPSMRSPEAGHGIRVADKILDG